MSATIQFATSVLSAAATDILALISLLMSSGEAAAVDNPKGQNPKADSVNIVSPLPLPINIKRNEEDPARHPFRLTGVIPSSVPDSGNNVTVGTVPARVRYVIEQYSMSCDVDAGGTLTNVYLMTSIAGVGVGSQDFLVPHFVQSNGFVDGQAVDLWAGSSQTRLYADPGQSIDVGRSGHGANVESCTGWVSGYSVALQ